MHWTLVDVLKLMQSVDVDALQRHVDEFYTPRKLGEHLVRHDIITGEQLELALVRQRVLNGIATVDDVSRLARLQGMSTARRGEAVTALMGAARVG